MTCKGAAYIYALCILPNMKSRAEGNWLGELGNCSLKIVSTNLIFFILFSNLK